jgi:hypothetical protein
MTLYRSAQGKMVDMTKLSQQHELTPAVGNAKLNARGDVLGPGGVIVQKREEAAAQYHKIPKKPVQETAVETKTEPVIEEPEIKPASSAPSVVAATKQSKDKQ